MKLIRKERNIYYEYYIAELTKEQEELYKKDKEKFMDEFIYNDKVEFVEPEEKRYINTTDMEYYLETEEEPKFNY